MKRDPLLELLEKEPHLDLLNLIDQDKYSILEQEFQKSAIGLSLEEFVSLMLEYLEFERKNEKLTQLLVAKLIDLFKEIDVNGDELLEWREFSSHIIELSFLSKHKMKGQYAKEYRLTYQNKKARYYRGATVSLKNLKYSGLTNHLITSDLDSSQFKVYDLFEERGHDLYYDAQKDQDYERLRRKDIVFNHSVSAHRKAILGMDIAEIPGRKNPLLVTSSNDLNIHLWDMGSWELDSTISTPEIQQCVRYVPYEEGKNPLLLSGGNDYVIHVYSLKRKEILTSLHGVNELSKHQKDPQGHSQPISDIIPILHQNMFASAGLDGRICLWDIRNQRYINTLNSGKSRSVNNLEWISSISALMASSSDHKINVYNTFTKEKIFSLHGHNAPVLSVKWVPDTYDVFSADSSGIVKLWDYRNWSCLQTINTNIGELTCLETGHSQQSKKRIFVGGKNLLSYSTNEPKNKDKIDETPAKEIIHNKEFMNLISVHKNNIKIWNLKNGKLLTNHAKLLEEEISSFCLDTRQRKFFVADYNFQLKSFNINTGALVKNYTSQSKHIIVKMIYYTVKDKHNRIKAQFLVCAYENGLIQFIDDSLQGSSNKNFDVKLHRTSIIDLKIYDPLRELGCEGLGIGSNDITFGGTAGGAGGLMVHKVGGVGSSKVCRLREKRQGKVGHGGKGGLENYLISFSRDNCILFIRLDTLRIEVNYVYEDAQRGIFACLDFYKDFLVFGCEDGMLRFFFLEEAKLRVWFEEVNHVFVIQMPDVVSMRLGYICAKSFYNEASDKVEEKGEFKTVCSLKVFEDVLFVGDSSGGLSVICLKEITVRLEEYVGQRRKILGMDQSALNLKKEGRTEKRLSRKGNKNQLQEIENRLKEVVVDTNFEWTLIRVDQCHPERITRIMAVFDQAIFTSSEDCSTKVWEITFADREEKRKRDLARQKAKLKNQKKSIKSISKLSALKRKRTFITETERKLDGTKTSNMLNVKKKNNMQKTVSIAVDTESISGLDTLMTNKLARVPEKKKEEKAAVEKKKKKKPEKPKPKKNKELEQYVKWKLLEQEELFENCQALKELVFHSKEIDSLTLMQNPFDFYQQMLLRQKKKKIFTSADSKVQLKETGRLEMSENSENWKVGLDFSPQENRKTVEAKALFEKIKDSNFKIRKDFRSLKTSMKSYKDFVDMKRENAHKRFKQALRAMEREEQEKEQKRKGKENFDTRGDHKEMGMSVARSGHGRGFGVDESKMGRDGLVMSEHNLGGSVLTGFPKGGNPGQDDGEEEKDFYFDIDSVIGDEWKEQ